MHKIYINNLTARIGLLSVVFYFLYLHHLDAASNLNFNIQSAHTSATHSDESIDIQFNCETNKVGFTLINGENNLTNSFVLSIIEDDVILFLKKYDLVPKDTIVLNFPNSGTSYHVKICSYSTLGPNVIEKSFVSCNNLNLNSGSDNNNPFAEEIELVNLNSKEFSRLDQVPVKQSISGISVQAPVMNGVQLELDISSIDEMYVLVQLVDLNGVVWNQFQKRLFPGNNTIGISLNNIKSGFFKTVIRTNKETFCKSFTYIN